MEHKQTAVQWLQECLNLHLTHDQKMQFEGLFQQAKEMEKQQIIEAFGNVSFTGEYDYVMKLRKKAEQYYNEEYNK